LSVGFSLDFEHGTISLQFPSGTEQRRLLQPADATPPVQKRKRGDTGSSNRRVRRKQVKEEETKQEVQLEQEAEQEQDVMAPDSSDLLAPLPGFQMPSQMPAWDPFADIASDYRPIFHSDEDIVAFNAQFAEGVYAEDPPSGHDPVGQTYEDDVLNGCLQWAPKSVRSTPDGGLFWLDDCPLSWHPEEFGSQSQEFGSQSLASKDAVAAAHCGCVRAGSPQFGRLGSACSAGHGCYYGQR
jgi:hypothetical protein